MILENKANLIKPKNKVMVENYGSDKLEELKEVREDKDAPRQARMHSYDEAVDVAGNVDL